MVKEIGAQDLIAQDGIAKLSVVGIGMRSHSGVAAKLFECLSAGGINIQMISTSEIKIAVIIDEAVVNQAANLAHEAFGLSGTAPDARDLNFGFRIFPSMPEQPVWTGSPSQVKNALPFFFATLAASRHSFSQFRRLDLAAGHRLCRRAGHLRALPLALRRRAAIRLTSERLLTSRGFLSRTTDSLELYRVKDMRIVQPFRLRLFGLENIELDDLRRNLACRRNRPHPRPAPARR